MEENKEIDFVVMGTLLIDEDMNLVKDRDNSNNLVIYNDDNRLDNWISRKMPWDWEAILFRREVADTYLDMDPQNTDKGHDIRFLMRAITRHKFACLSLPGACYLFWDGNITTEIFQPVDYVHEAAQISRFLEIYGDQNVSEKTKEKIPEIIKDHFQENLFINSLKLMGFSENEIDKIFQITSSILIFGNLKFDKSEDDNINFDNISQLLNVDSNNLKNMLAFKQITAGGESYKIELSQQQSLDSRDALVKTMYGYLFKWLVQRINESIRIEDNSNNNKNLFIGVLDIFGFEIFRSRNGIWET